MDPQWLDRQIDQFSIYLLLLSEGVALYIQLLLRVGFYELGSIR